MIYLDPAGHMVTDGQLQELHIFAKLIGLKQRWLKEKPYPHYSLVSKSKRKTAVFYGAIGVSTKELINLSEGCK